MSDKIPISLHNSDLFFKPEFTETDQKEINTDNVTNSILKKGPTLGENSHFTSLHTSYLLPPLHSSPYLSKAVTSYLSTKQEFVKRYKNGENEQNKKKESEPLLPTTRSSFDEKVFPLRYGPVSRLRLPPQDPTKCLQKNKVVPSARKYTKTKFWYTNAKAKLLQGMNFLYAKVKFVPKQDIVTHNKDQALYQNKECVISESRFLDKKDNLILNKTNTENNVLQFESKTDTNTIKLFSDFSLKALERLNTSICSTVSREFLLVTTNLILFSVLAVVQRSKHIQMSHTVLGTSKMSNTTVSRFNTIAGRECLYKMHSGCLDPVREHMKGVFLGKVDINFYATDRALQMPVPKQSFGKQNITRTDGNKADIPEKRFSFVFLPFATHQVIPKLRLFKSDCVPAARTCYLFATPRLNLKQFFPSGSQRSTVFVQSLIQPWHCIKSCNTLNKEIVTTRSLSQINHNVNLYNDDQIWGIQYYLPFYRSQKSLLLETDTIPSKRDSVSYKQTKSFNPFGKLQANSWITLSDSVLKRCFYKYGLLLVSPSKLYNKSQSFKETDKSYLVRSEDLDEFKSGVKRTKNKNYTTTPTIFIKKNDLDARATVDQSVIKIKNGYVLLAKHNCACFEIMQNKAKPEHLLKQSFDKSVTKTRFWYELLLFAWSRFHLSKLTLTSLIPVRNKVSVFAFMPDNLVLNGSVSGYQFPSLQDKDISYLFRKIAIFHFYFNCPTADDNAFAQKLFTQITTPFRTLQANQLLFQALSTTSSFLNQDVAVLNQEKTSHLSERAVNLPYLRQMEKRLPISRLEIHGLEADVFNKMQYTQINLDETKNIFDLFKELGRDYEEYLRQPKDSLPALIISPSLENDREIEEEGIRIFRKREFVKNKQFNLQEKSGESYVDSASSLSDVTSELPENNTRFGSRPSTNETQNSKTLFLQHQLLVKNALRQAQEEIDSIAKKEEKGTEKDKQVIPPLTRLEALYTIRNRERKHEQAKEFTTDKGILSHLRSNKAKLSFNASYKDEVIRGATKHIPFFEKLFLCRDKPINQPLNECIQGQTFGGSGTFTPLLLSNLGDKNILTDRKHSFFGEMSLPCKILTAQDQKQIFHQKANCTWQTKHFNSISDTVPLSFLSQFSVLKRSDYNKKQVPQFQVGVVKMKSLSPATLFSETVTTQSLLPVTTSNSSLEEFKRSLPDIYTAPNRIYFYDTPSQNKVCQSSAPKVKSTPLQSPVSHRVWQPKRMEPSTFRVPYRTTNTFVLPKITQKDWKNMMNWQLKKHFFEEDKRLLPLSLNSNKKLKIKRCNLYLPWISIEKATCFSNSNEPLPFSQRSSVWPLTRLDLTKEPIKITPSHGLFSDLHAQQCGNTLYKSSNYWRLPTQQNLYTTALPVKKQTSTSFLSRDHIAQKDSSLRTIVTKEPIKNSDTRVLLPKKKLGIYKRVSNEFVLFESVTKHSWLFIYTFVFVLMFKQLFKFVYKVGLKDFFVNFLNSDFGRTITSEEFRYSVQNLPLAESYRPKKRLQELFGLERNKVQLLEIVWFLRNKCQGRHGIRGILLLGPPGVESVSVVQAIAGEANLPVIVESLEKIAQDSEPQRQLEQLYRRAHKQAPCILFLDQLDSIGARRDQLFTDTMRGHNGNPSLSPISGQSQSSLNSHTSASVLNMSSESQLFESTDDNNNTISSNPFQKNQTVFTVAGQDTNRGNGYPNQVDLPQKESFVSSGNKLNVVLRLLTILDGITQSSGVVTVATARDVTKLDPALLRPKRFDRKIYLSLPNQQDRVHLFKLQTQSIGHAKEMPWNYLSLQTENMSATDIRSAINYSLFRAVLRGSVHTVETLEYGISCVKNLTDKRAEKNKTYREPISSSQKKDTTVTENTSMAK